MIKFSVTGGEIKFFSQRDCISLTYNFRSTININGKNSNEFGVSENSYSNIKMYWIHQALDINVGNSSPCT